MKLNKLLLLAIVAPLMIGCVEKGGQTSSSLTPAPSSTTESSSESSESESSSSDIVPEHTALDFLEVGKLRFENYQPAEHNPYLFYYVDGALVNPLTFGQECDLDPLKTLQMYHNTGCQEELFVIVAYDLKGEDRTRYAVYIDIPMGMFNQLMVEINRYYIANARKVYISIDDVTLSWDTTFSEELNDGIDTAPQWDRPQYIG